MSQEPRILEKRLYTATATGGRDGTVRTDDGALDLTIVPPKALGERDVFKLIELGAINNYAIKVRVAADVLKDPELLTP